MFWSTSKNSENTKSPEDTLKNFIKVSTLQIVRIPLTFVEQRSPKSTYTFDSERDAPDSEICRQGNNKECIIVRLWDSSPERFAVNVPSGRFIWTASGCLKPCKTWGSTVLYHWNQGRRTWNAYRNLHERQFENHAWQGRLSCDLISNLT